jgi:deoxyribonucleoside regulator
MSTGTIQHLSDEKQRRLLQMVTIAELYYIEGLTQAEIAERLQLTRLKVNQLLQDARKDGIIRIEIVNPLSTCTDLQQRLEEHFGLRRAVVIPAFTDSSGVLARELGKAAASLVAELINDGDLVGIGWGTTVYELVHAFECDRQITATFIPLIGGLGEVHAHFQINEFARVLANTADGRWKALHAPFLVERKEIKDALLSDSLINELVSLWSHLDHAVVGIGMSISKSPMLLTQYFTNAHLMQMERQGIVGDICSRFFDKDGILCNWDINDRLIGISLDELHKAKNVIAVAGGTVKTTAILAALNGGHIDMLVIDEQTAKALLRR